MDIPALNYVVNFDMAEDPETHTHRIGRTGRAGRTGLAISFCSEGEYKHLKALHKLHGKDCMIEMEHDFRIELASNNKREGSKKKGGKTSNRNRNNRRRNERHSGENRSKKRSESFA
jgi:ATP-dependent RNA helicase RhlE